MAIMKFNMRAGLLGLVVATAALLSQQRDAPDVCVADSLSLRSLMIRQGVWRVEPWHEVSGVVDVSQRPLFRDNDRFSSPLAMGTSGLFGRVSAAIRGRPQPQASLRRWWATEYSPVLEEGLVLPPIIEEEPAEAVEFSSMHSDPDRESSAPRQSLFPSGRDTWASSSDLHKPHADAQVWESAEEKEINDWFLQWAIKESIRSAKREKEFDDIWGDSEDYGSFEETRIEAKKAWRDGDEDLARALMQSVFQHLEDEEFQKAIELSLTEQNNREHGRTVDEVQRLSRREELDQLSHLYLHSEQPGSRLDQNALPNTWVSRDAPMSSQIDHWPRSRISDWQPHALCQSKLRNILETHTNAHRQTALAFHTEFDNIWSNEFSLYGRDVRDDDDEEEYKQLASNFFWVEKDVWKACVILARYRELLDHKENEETERIRRAQHRQWLDELEANSMQCHASNAPAIDHGIFFDDGTDDRNNHLAANGRPVVTWI